jgi:hypothetical protein
MMTPHAPEDWPRLFERHLNASDLEAVVALYEPNVSFVPGSGPTVVGHDGIRHMLAGFIGVKARLHGQVRKVITADNIPSGKTVEIFHKRSRSSAASPTTPGSSSSATPTAGNQKANPCRFHTVTAKDVVIEGGRSLGRW